MLSEEKESRWHYRSRKLRQKNDVGFKIKKAEITQDQLEIGFPEKEKKDEYFKAFEMNLLHVKRSISILYDIIKRYLK